MKFKKFALLALIVSASVNAQNDDRKLEVPSRYFCNQTKTLMLSAYVFTYLVNKSCKKFLPLIKDASKKYLENFLKHSKNEGLSI